MTKNERARSDLQLVDLGGQGCRRMPFAAGDYEARPGMTLEDMGERLNQVLVALLEFLASDGKDDLVFLEQTKRTSHSCSTVFASITQPLRTSSPPHNGDPIWSNSELFHGRILNGLTDCVKMVGEMPRGEAVEHLREFEADWRDVGVIHPGLVVGGIDQIGHYRNRQTDGGNAASNVRVVERRVNEIGSLIDNHTTQSEDLAQQGAAGQKPDIMARLQHFLFEADGAPMKTADDGGDVTALELWKQFDQGAFGSSRKKRVDDKEVLRALCSLSDAALA